MFRRIFVLLAVGLVLSAGAIQAPQIQTIYSDSFNDPWNRIFSALFTRTVKVRFAEDLLGDRPSIAYRVMGFQQQFRISAQPQDRFESGDRGIEPLYPSFLTDEGLKQVLNEPLYGELMRALRDAVREQRTLAPLHRALMQADAWAAHDVLLREQGLSRDLDDAIWRRRDEMVSLLAQFIRKLALTAIEIRQLPDNYEAARPALNLPDLFSKESEWFEIRWLDIRAHERNAQDRRASRIFIKPRLQPTNRIALVNEVKDKLPEAQNNVEAAALITRNLLVDTTGAPIPSPITYEVQLRTLNGGVAQHELSRRGLLDSSLPGGFLTIGESDPAYMVTAGNDYGFATIHRTREGSFDAILGTLRMRCISCHGPEGRDIVTFNFHSPDALRSVAVLDQQLNQHAIEVAQRKADTADFKALLARWK